MNYSDIKSINPYLKERVVDYLTLIFLCNLSKNILKLFFIGKFRMISTLRN